MRIYTTVHGPQVWSLVPDYTDPNTEAGDPLVVRGASFERGDVVMQAIDGTDTATGLDYTKDYDDPFATVPTIAWQRNVFTPIITAEALNFKPVWVLTKAVGEDKEGRGVEYGRVKVKCDLTSSTVTAGQAFKVKAAVSLTPAADAGGACRIVALATKRQVFDATGVQLVECFFDGRTGHGIIFS